MNKVRGCVDCGSNLEYSSELGIFVCTKKECACSAQKIKEAGH